MEGGSDGMHWASMPAYEGPDGAAHQGFLLCIDSLHRHVECTQHVAIVRNCDITELRVAVVCNATKCLIM